MPDYPTDRVAGARENILGALATDDPVGALLPPAANEFRLSVREALQNTRNSRFGRNYHGNQTGVIVPTHGEYTGPVDDRTESPEPTGSDLVDEPLLGSNEGIGPGTSEFSARDEGLRYMNEFIRNQYPTVPAGTELSSFFNGEKFTKWLISKIGGAAASTILGGGLLGAVAGNRSANWLNDVMGNYNWWGPDQGIMSPDSADFVNPNPSAPPGGIMSPDSPDFVPPEEAPNQGWQGRNATDSGYWSRSGQGGGGGYGSITGGGAFNYATRLKRKVHGPTGQG